jgi:hypothetical protein
MFNIGISKNQEEYLTLRRESALLRKCTKSMVILLRFVKDFSGTAGLSRYIQL